jgi:hypothetical protein
MEMLIKLTFIGIIIASIDYFNYICSSLLRLNAWIFNYITSSNDVMIPLSFVDDVMNGQKITQMLTRLPKLLYGQKH